MLPLENVTGVFHYSDILLKKGSMLKEHCTHRMIICKSVLEFVKKTWFFTRASMLNREHINLLIGRGKTFNNSKSVSRHPLANSHTTRAV